MEKAVRTSSGGRNEKTGGLLINRLLPNEQTAKIGPFVSLGHIYPVFRPFSQPEPVPGQHASPHRGTVVLSYLLGGSLQHRDSLGHRVTVDSGDVLWLKTGNGILQDETPVSDGRSGSLHALRWWINLPAVNKEEDPEFRLLRARDVPELELPDQAGCLRVLLGGCGVCESPLTTYVDEFIFHVQLLPKSEFTYTLRRSPEYGVFIPAGEVRVNGEAACNSHLFGFPGDEPVVRLYNPGITGADAFIFGGGAYLEPIVSEGPFVMNSRAAIARAYADFFDGRYGYLRPG